MASAAEKLASSLAKLETLQSRGAIAIRSRDISRTHRERLVKSGFLEEVMKGWYIPSRPDGNAGESTVWHTAFWGFCAQYLSDRFGDDWSLSPEQSLVLHAGNRTVPTRLLVRAIKGGNSKTDLPHDTSLLETRATIAAGDRVRIEDGLRLFPVEDALVLVPEVFFRNHPTEARTILAMMPDPSRLLGRLLDGGHTRAAGRLAGAFRSIGSERIADEILSAMKAASHEVREIDPFEETRVVADAGRITSPHMHRIRLKWESMREDVIEVFPEARPVADDMEAYLERIDDIYVADAYHSLSIEGYRVSPELIEKVRSGAWNPENDDADRASRDALAARGYWDAFQRVKKSVRAVLEGADAGRVAERDMGHWYRNLFAPSVTAGLLEASQLAGYRSSPVHIRQSRHVPMGAEAVRDCMPVFFDLLEGEKDPGVRIVLGHFILVFIHPFPDGNGRIARFLMNVMMAAAGQPWTVVRVERRADYVQALEAASVQGDIRPFAAFLAAARATT